MGHVYLFQNDHRASPLHDPKARILKKIEDKERETRTAMSRRKRKHFGFQDCAPAVRNRAYVLVLVVRRPAARAELEEAVLEGRVREPRKERRAAEHTAVDVVGLGVRRRMNHSLLNMNTYLIVISEISGNVAQDFAFLFCRCEKS